HRAAPRGPHRTSPDHQGRRAGPGQGQALRQGEPHGPMGIQGAGSRPGRPAAGILTRDGLPDPGPDRVELLPVGGRRIPGPVDDDAAGSMIGAASTKTRGCGGMLFWRALAGGLGILLLAGAAPAQEKPRFGTIWVAPRKPATIGGIVVGKEDII